MIQIHSGETSRPRDFAARSVAARCIEARFAPPGGGGTLGISGWGCAAGTLEPLTYTRASSAEFCYSILEQTHQILPILE